MADLIAIHSRHRELYLVGSHESLFRHSSGISRYGAQARGGFHALSEVPAQQAIRVSAQRQGRLLLSGWGLKPLHRGALSRQNRSTLHSR